MGGVRLEFLAPQSEARPLQAIPLCLQKDLRLECYLIFVNPSQRVLVAPEELQVGEFPYGDPWGGMHRGITNLDIKRTSCPFQGFPSERLKPSREVLALVPPHPAASLSNLYIWHF